MKRCTRCKQTKQISDYHFNKCKKDGLADQCKECKKFHNRNTNQNTWKLAQEFLNSYKHPDEQNTDATIRYYVENLGYEKWSSVLEKFAAIGDGGCVHWLGALNNSAYPLLNVRFPNGGQYTVRAHRLSFALYHGYEALPHSSNGPSADTPVLDHICENSVCINPLHLQVVTNAENIAFKAGRV
jgi:hypothetical protein